MILSSDGSVLAEGSTDDDGNYSLEVESNTMVSVVVLSVIPDPEDLADIDVVMSDNTHTNPSNVYGISGDLEDSGDINSERDLHASSGWGGSSYSSPRDAAPFAILDNIYDCMQLVRSVDSSAVFEQLFVFWSEDNRPASGDVTAGEIGTSFFRQSINNNVVTNTIFILGAEDVDTDEYDRHVIVHEWGHYFEANFSRSDPIGGPHSGGDRLDMRLAFSEGWGTALAAMVLGDTDYIDTFNTSQASAGVSDIEDNTVTNPGWYSEASVWAILYDLFDSNDEGLVDTVSLGFEPIYQVMTNQQRTTPLFTSIFTFITALKEDNPGSVAAINALVDHHNIVAATINAEGSTETNNAGNSYSLPIYTELPLDGATVNLCMNDRFGTSNKLANFRYLKATIPSPGTYSIEATRSPVGTIEGDPDLYVYLEGQTVITSNVFNPNSESLTDAVTAAGDYVIELREWNFQNNITPRDSESCYDITLTTQ